MAGLSEARMQMMTFHGFFVKLLYMQLCDRARRCGILAYSTLSSDEQRKQMRRFHGKDFRQKLLVVTQRQSEAMWHTGVFHIVERRAEEADAAISRKRFSSKVVSCNATTERGDELYLTYCPLPNDEARTQMMTFHGKRFSSKAVLYHAMKISRTGSTGVRPVREIECAAAECRFSRKKEFTSSFLHWSSSQPWVRQPWRQRP